jgi:hypothetical protein
MKTSATIQVLGGIASVPFAEEIFQHNLVHGAIVSNLMPLNKRRCISMALELQSWCGFCSGVCLSTVRLEI